MMFKSDSQRKAVFANVFSGRPKFDSNIIYEKSSKFMNVSPKIIATNVKDLEPIIMSSGKFSKNSAEQGHSKLSKWDMLTEIFDNDLDFFQNNFDLKQCALDGANKLSYESVKEAYDRWKAVDRGEVFSKFRRSGDYKSTSKIEGKMGNFGNVWRAETELPEFDITLDRPEDSYRHHDVALTEMSPEEFIQLQYDQYRVRHLGHERPVSFEEWKYPDEEKIDRFRKMLRGEKHEPVKNIYGPDSKLPIPVLELNEEGGLSGFQEGFHRAESARREGFKAIPVLIARKRPR